MEMMPEAFEYHGPPKRCPQCEEEFMPTTIRQVYCSSVCNEKAKYERRRAFREKKGLCLQCGGPMDHPQRIGSGKKTGKRTISYCSRCRERFRELKATKPD